MAQDGVPPKLRVDSSALATVLAPIRVGEESPIGLSRSFLTDDGPDTTWKVTPMSKQYDDPNQPFDGAPPRKTHPEVIDDRPMFAPYRPPTAKEAPPDDTMPHRPIVRLPVAVLTVFDDGRTEGESHRLRSEVFTIGRTEGDLLLPHDGMVSRKHATITRKSDKGRVRWLLEDLSSHNGTFIRVADAILSHGQEMLLGGKRYAFHAAPRSAALAAEAKGAPAGDAKTQGWQAISAQDLIPSLLEVRPDGSKGEPIYLADGELIIGRDPACQVVLHDPMVSPQHAKLHKDDRDNWILENLNSLNGTWVRVEKLSFDRTGQFLIGEQRFVLRI